MSKKCEKYTSMTGWGIGFNVKVKGVAVVRIGAGVSADLPSHIV